MNKEEILEAIGKELEFYRSRQLPIHYFSILAILLVITGQQKLQVANECLANIAYTVFFAIILFLDLTFSSSYTERIHHLRDKRADLFSGEQNQNPFPRHSEFKKLSPNILYSLTVSLIAFLGMIVVWIGK